MPFCDGAGRDTVRRAFVNLSATRIESNCLVEGLDRFDGLIQYEVEIAQIGVEIGIVVTVFASGL